MQALQPMQTSRSRSTMPSFRLSSAVTGQIVTQGAFVQWLQRSTAKWRRTLGNGLVFNAGERVEGYSNFLWTLLVAAGMRLSLDPVPLTQAAGLACYAALLALTAAIARRVHARGALALPVATLALAGDYHSR